MDNNLAIDNSNIINLNIINGKIEKKEPKKTLDGKIKNTKSNKKDGVSSEVYPFTQFEIFNIVNYLDKQISEAKTEKKVEQWERNKLLFILGINIGLRASDIRFLKWSFFFNDNMEWREFYVIQPKKTASSHKYVKLYFNDALKGVVTDFINKYPVENLDSYIFISTNGKPITTQTMWNIINNIALDVGITKNIGCHSLRKTFGYFCWHNAENKDKALVILQSLFNHSSTQVTQKYIGILDTEIKDMYNCLNLGYKTRKEACDDVELLFKNTEDEKLEISLK